MKNSQWPENIIFVMILVVIFLAGLLIWALGEWT